MDLHILALFGLRIPQIIGQGRTLALKTPADLVSTKTDSMQYWTFIENSAMPLLELSRDQTADSGTEVFPSGYVKEAGVG